MAAVVATLVALTVTAPPAEPAPGVLTPPVYAGAGLDAATFTDIEAFAWATIEQREQEAARAAAEEAATLLAAEAAAAAERSSRVPPTGGTVAAPLERTTWPTSLEPCGGDLPPCSVKQRESGGSYSARNPSGACGAWQIIPSTWNGYAGYASACDAPPSVQDDKARQLWAGGAGCSHWSAC